MKQENRDQVQNDPSGDVDSQTPPHEFNTAEDQQKPKKRKRKVEMACIYCRRSHMICDNSRPCQRCIKRGIGHLCRDEPTGNRQKKHPGKPEHGLLAGGQISGDDTIAHPNSKQNTNATNDHSLQAFAGENYKVRDDSTAATTLRNQNLNKNLPFNQEPFFYSEHAGSEFSSLNEFLSMIDDPDLVNGALNNEPSNSDNSLYFPINTENSVPNGFNQIPLFSPALVQNTAFLDVPLGGPQRHPDQELLPGSTHTEVDAPKEKPLSGKENGSDSTKHHPVISDSARDKFFLTAADPTTEISPEERLKQVIKAKLEAGLLQPYNYAKGYARLQSYMDNYMNRTSRQRILKPLLIFRPAFRAIAKTLKDVDLVLVEESFERMLLDYDRVFTSMAIPACLWRRTGEIYRGNKEFASLVGATTDDLKDGKLAIYELMSEESAVNFWEKYGAIAFDKGQKAVLTSCNLRTKDGLKRKSCCLSFTIRRDRYNIPSCIVGNFIPIDP